MQHQNTTYCAEEVGPGRPQTVSPLDLISAIDQVVVLVQGDGNADIYAAWAAATLARKLNITSVLSPSTDPAGIVHDLGTGWAAGFAAALDRHPDQTAQLLRAAKAAIEQVMAAVKLRGFAG